MNIGDVLRLRNLRHYGNSDAKGRKADWFEYKAGDGEVFVVLLLGTEKFDGTQPLDPVTRLKQLGWQLPEKKEEKKEQKEDETKKPKKTKKK